MAVRPVVVWPDARLRQETRTVTEISDEVRALYRDLVDTMYAHNGLGIAAIQIGDPTKMFVVEPSLAGREANADPVAFINPEVLWSGDESQLADEGCLSFPGIYVPVERPLRARMRAMDLNGEMFEVEGHDLYARCLLHEYDHLDGKLLVDFVGPLKKQMIKRKLAKRNSQDSAA
ncbi:MAG: peptide deformylase [Proteobacteria bacterium]|nr:peptide deformylase [Pseudomonadota bacterium]